MTERFYELYEELVKIVENLREYYDIDKIKSYSVYVWSKHEEENVFDILKDEIVFYVDNHKIPSKVLPIIEIIQSKLKEIELNK